MKSIIRGRHALAAAAAALLWASSFAQTVEPQQIVVTAARIEQALPDALPSTRVITRTEIDAAQAADVPALLRQLTSIDVAQTGPLGAQTSLFLRGADSRQVLVLIDGVPFARADFGTASWQYLPLDQIERIEIVRGNHSSVYGAQAVGGVVQIVTRAALAPQARVALGAQGRRQAALAGGARLSAGTKLSGNLSAQSTEGYSAKDPAADPGANPDRDGAWQHGGSLRVDQDWMPGHRTHLSWSASRTKSDYDGFTPGLTDVLKTRVSTAALSSRHVLMPGWALQADLGQTSERFDDPTGFTIAARSRVRNAALALAWQAQADHALQLGAETRRDRYADGNGANPHRQTDSLRLGWQGRLAEGWQGQLHLRRDHSSTFGDASTGLAALAWQFAPGWKASAQLSSGFSAPSFLDEQFANPAVPLRAERSRQAEVALQWRTQAASLRLAWFDQRQRDRIDFDPVTFEAGNISRARNRGIELMADVALPLGKLNAELTLQDPRNAVTDQRLLRRSRESLALGWTGALDGWALCANVRHTGMRIDTDPVSFSATRNPARTTLGAGLARELAPGWRLSLALDNLSGENSPEVLGYTAAPRSALLALQATFK